VAIRPLSLNITSVRDRPSWRSASDAALSLSEPKLLTPMLFALEVGGSTHLGIGVENEPHHVAQRSDHAQVAALAVYVGDAGEPDMHHLQLTGRQCTAAAGAAAGVHDRHLEALLGVKATSLGEMQRQRGVDQRSKPRLIGCYVVWVLRRRVPRSAPATIASRAALALVNTALPLHPRRAGGFYAKQGLKVDDRWTSGGGTAAAVHWRPVSCR